MRPLSARAVFLRAYMCGVPFGCVFGLRAAGCAEDKVNTHACVCVCVHVCVCECVCAGGACKCIGMFRNG